MQKICEVTKQECKYICVMTDCFLAESKTISASEQLRKIWGLDKAETVTEKTWIELRDYWQSKTTIPAKDRTIMDFEQFLLGFQYATDLNFKEMCDAETRCVKAQQLALKYQDEIKKIKEEKLY